ncbi:MAG: hypothetical protein ACKVJG_09570 [Candidatus Latescibacterota bacterium]
MGSILLFTNPHHEDSVFGWHRDLGAHERQCLLETRHEDIPDPRVREALPLAMHPYYDRWRELQLG